MNVLPAEQEEIFLEHGVDLRGGESFPNGSAMFVIHHAARLVQHFPATLPGQVAEVGVFHIERPQKFIEAAQLQEFAPVEGAGAASSVEAWIKIGDGRIVAVAHAQAAILPPALGEPGLFAKLVRVSKENLAGYGENLWVGESSQQRREKIRLRRACRY